MLNRTLSNVKTRGTWGEMQLGTILADTLAPNQYKKQVKVKEDSDGMVDFVVDIPSKDGETHTYLPIDSKFPVDRYGALIGTAEDPQSYAKASKELEKYIKEEARSIRSKYICPPVTTDFAVMFLPTESMYAEVLRIAGLAEYCQHTYRVIIAGPATTTALLNSLHVGFSNVALNKKTEDVRKMLQAVKMQYEKLDELIDITKKKLEAAVTSTDKLKQRTGMIKRKMDKIEDIPTVEADDILGIAGDGYI